MSEPSYSELEMIDVEIANNVCSGDGCGAFLAKKSSLENCTATKNKVAESNKNSSSLLFVPASSTTTIRGLAASRNDHTVIRVRDGVLSLLNTTFNRNSLKSQQAKKMKASCVHSVKSSVEISKCYFTANEGFRGTVILAQKSDISVSGSVFRYNVGLENGGCIYAARSKVILEDTTATKSSSEDSGGFMYTEKSKVRLKNTTAIESRAGINGGFMSAYTSVVTIENTTANKSSADFGGFMFAYVSEVTIENTTANKSTAVRVGGFMYAYESNVTIENTTAIKSSSEDSAGFMYAYESNVTLKATDAIESRAWYNGGFMRGSHLELRIALSQFSSSNSNTSGGFAAIESSSIFINDSEIVGGRSKYGGAIWMKNTDMEARNLSISHCRADNSGGGVMSRAHSTFLCADCKFENNSAEKGNGGAVFFDSQPDQTLALQIVQSRFENNSAELGGRPRRKKKSTAFDVYV